MHLLHQQQKQLFGLFIIIFFTPTIFTFVDTNSSTDSISSTGYIQGLTSLQTNSSRSAMSSTVSTIRPRPTLRPTTRPRATTKLNDSDSDFDTFSENLKRAAFILAGIALGLGILRICLMLCKSRSPSSSFANRHSPTIRPQISTIEHQQFKPDLPPAYAEAISHLETDANKLPTYEELPHDQREDQQYAYGNHGYVTTQV